jgi:hypothetical protein
MFYDVFLMTSQFPFLVPHHDPNSPRVVFSFSSTCVAKSLLPTKQVLNKDNYALS